MALREEANIANSPATPANALPYNESPDVQQINAADVKRMMRWSRRL